MAAMGLTTKPINVSTLGLIRDSASQRTIIFSNLPQARPKAEVQVILVSHGHVRKPVPSDFGLVVDSDQRQNIQLALAVRSNHAGRFPNLLIEKRTANGRA